MQAIENVARTRHLQRLILDVIPSNMRSRILTLGLLLLILLPVMGCGQIQQELNDFSSRWKTLDPEGRGRLFLFVLRPSWPTGRFHDRARQSQHTAKKDSRALCALQ